jgi:hypothetical protein
VQTLKGRPTLGVSVLSSRLPHLSGPSRPLQVKMASSSSAMFWGPNCGFRKDIQSPPSRTGPVSMTWIPRPIVTIRCRILFCRVGVEQ